MPVRRDTGALRGHVSHVMSSRSRARSAGGVARLLAVAVAALLTSACAPRPTAPASGPASPSTTTSPSTTAAPMARGAWQRIPDGPLSARQGGLAVRVAGRFLVLGGSAVPACPSNASCVDPEVPPLRDGAAFDPVTSRWSRIADAPFAPEYYQVPVVVGGLLYLSAQDATGTGRQRLTAYDPARNQWSDVPFPPVRHPQLVAAGDTLVAVSQSSRRIVRYDAAATRWRALPADPLDVATDRRAAWAAGRLLLAAPVGAGRPSAQVELATLDGSLRTWHRLPDRKRTGGLPEAAGDTVRFWYCRTRCPEGSTLDLTTGAWRAAPVIDPSSTAPTCIPSAINGTLGARAVVASGLYDARSGAWSALPPLPVPSCVGGAMAAAGGDAILVWGGTAYREDGDDPKRVNSAAGWLLRP